MMRGRIRCGLKRFNCGAFRVCVLPHLACSLMNGARRDRPSKSLTRVAAQPAAASRIRTMGNVSPHMGHACSYRPGSCPCPGRCVYRSGSGPRGVNEVIHRAPPGIEHPPKLPASRCPRLDLARDGLAGGEFRGAQIEAALQVQPALCIAAEVARQTKRRIGRNAAALTHDVVDA